MSHPHTRKQNDCLNCGHRVLGNYCHHCGQQNLEPKETIWQLLNHFFEDITHFDGKIFKSVKLVILRPGFLSKQYILGKRMSYLNPIRMYLFVSAIFFLILFSFTKVEEKNMNPESYTNSQIDQMDSLKFMKLAMATNNGKPISKEEFKKGLQNTKLHIAPGNYRSKAQYDSVIHAGIKKHNWFERMLVYKDIELNEKYHENGKAILVAIFNKFLHTIPQMLFVLLPLFALGLKLLYIRRKEFYYVDHAIFTLHYYIFIFIDMLLIYGIKKLQELTHWDWMGYITVALVLAMFFYLYKAMRNFYMQGRAKTILKFIVLLVIFLMLTSFLFVVFFFFSMFGI